MYLKGEIYFFFDFPSSNEIILMCKKKVFS